MVGYFFFLQLALGMLAFLVPVPLHTTGKGFGRLIGLIALGSLLFALLLRLRIDLRAGAVGVPLIATAAAFAACFLFVGQFAKRDRREHTLALHVATTVSLVALIVAIRPLEPYWTTLLNALLSSLLLGAITDAMVLGHWYIVLPKMTLVPLKRLTLAVMVLLVARLLFVVLIGSPAWPVGLDAHPERLWPALYTVQRLLVGIVVPFIFGIMTWKTAQIRSTQSATGILYVTNAFVFVGELISAYMTYGLGQIC